MSAARTNMSVPLPLSYPRALEWAAALRESRPEVWTWATIAEAMALYHGFERSPGWWRSELRDRVAARPRGVPFVSAEKAGV